MPSSSSSSSSSSDNEKTGSSQVNMTPAPAPASSTTTTKSTMIRPKVRKIKAATAAASSSTPTVMATISSNEDPLVKDVRTRMDSWMGLNNNKSSKNVKPAAAAPTVVISSSLPDVEGGEGGGGKVAPFRSSLPSEPDTNAPQSILKVPKYSSKTTTSNHNNNNNDDDVIVGSNDYQQDHPPNNKKGYTPICKDIVVERDPRRHPPRRKPNVRPSPAEQQQQQQPPNHMAVEGYTPVISPSMNNSNSNSNSNPSAVTGLEADGSTTNDHGTQLDSTDTTTTTAATATTSPGKTENDDNNNKDEDKEEEDTSDLILNSLEDLMRAAGQELPSSNKIDENTQMVEADLQFSVMTQSDYDDKFAQLKREEQEEREAQQRMFLGQDNVFGDEEGEEENDDDEDDEDDDDSFMEMLMEQPEQSDDEEGELEIRAFRKFWDALTDWITPEAVQYIASLEQQAKENDNTILSNNNNNNNHNANNTIIETPQVDRSDIGASRCAGLMAMVKLYLPSILCKELNQPPHLQRVTEQRLGNLLRTFNYSREAPKLEVKLWKAMTCIFLEMILVETTTKTTSNITTSPAAAATAVVGVPPSVKAVGMTIDEYTYLSRKALQTFAAATGTDDA